MSDYHRPSRTTHALGDENELRKKSICFFSIGEIAERVSVSPRTVRRWIDNGKLIAYRFGAAVRISEEDFREFLARHRG